MPGIPFDISVVVPTYNRREIVVQLLDSLLCQTLPATRFEVIVVVDGSSDGTAECLGGMAPPFRLRVIEQKNRGPASARNTGTREASSDLVLFLDDDMRCDPGLLAAHFRAHQYAGPVVVFGALFLSSDSRGNLASECFKREIGGYHTRHTADSNAEWTMMECTFSNASVPREVLVKVNGFDEQFRMREDLELGVRLKETGVRMKYVKSATAFQYYSKSALDLLADAEVFGAADAMFARKHPELKIEGHLLGNDSGIEPDWRRNLRALFVKHPILETLFLAPLCYFGDALFRVPSLRAIGVRALQMRRRVHWMRSFERSMRP